MFVEYGSIVVTSGESVGWLGVAVQSHVLYLVRAPCYSLSPTYPESATLNCYDRRIECCAQNW